MNCPQVFSLWAFSSTLGKGDTNVNFMWSQLVWQEIGMWIREGKQVNKDEFNWMVKRRGFDNYMENYLKELLKYVSLGKEL